MRPGAIARVLAVTALVAACNNTPSTPPSAAPGANPAATAAAEATVPGPLATVPAAEPETPTSADLIRDALAAGRIDEDTALAYRVFAMYGAPELPEEYRTSGWTEDGDALDLAASRLDSMPSALAEAVRPLLVRPTDPTSAFVGGAASATAQLASVRSATMTAAVTCGANGWASIDGVSNFKVWGRCGSGFSDADLELVAGVLDKLWTDESTYMGRQPRVDGGSPDEGGDDRVDVYLVGNCVTRAGACRTHTGLACARRAPVFEGTYGSRKTSGYIVINRASISDPETPATVAHELFHVLQFAFNADGDTLSDNHWFYEASATWAEYKFVGDPTATPRRFEEYQGTDRSLQDLANENAYRSYVWPLFMEEEVGDGTIANTWAALQGVGTREEFTDAIDAQLSFKSRFRDFAVRDWNDDDVASEIGPMLPQGAVGSPRVEPTGHRRGPNAILRPNQRGDPLLLQSVAIRSLAPWFEDLQVDNAVGQVTLDFSGLGPRAALDVDLLVYVQGLGWDRRQVVDDKIQLCRNVPADKVTEIVVVLSNHDKDSGSLVIGEWTAESLKDPCPVESTADITVKSVLMEHIPQWDEHNVRIQNLPDHVITVTAQIHLVIVHDGSRVLAGFGSTITYDRTVTGTRPEPPIHCQGSVGLWQSQAPSALADPNALGGAHIQGDPSALQDTELMIEVGIAPPNAPEECWAGFGLFPFTRVDEHSWKLERHSSQIDPDRLYSSVTDDASGTLSVP